MPIEDYFNKSKKTLLGARMRGGSKRGFVAGYDDEGDGINEPINNMSAEEYQAWINRLET